MNFFPFKIFYYFYNNYKILHMNLTKYFLFLLLTFSAYLSFSQQTKQQKLDSLKTKLSKDSAWIFRYKKVRPLFAIDQRNSFIQSNPVNITGLQFGVKLKERHNLGMGFYAVSPN